MRAWILIRLLGLAALLALAGCSNPRPKQTDALDQQQYAWSAAIRWNDFDGAVNLLDPTLRAARPPTELDLARYQQVQISAYRDKGSSRDPVAGTAARDIEIGVINRHTQAERTVRYRETWRWDAQAKTWWVTSGLPDLWDGQ